MSSPKGPNARFVVRLAVGNIEVSDGNLRRVSTNRNIEVKTVNNRMLTLRFPWSLPHSR
jgi:hypothetical protein